MWNDITSYGRDDKERNPTTFEVKNGALRIVITCGHIMYRPKWVMHCFALSIDTYPLDECATKEQAELEAMKIVFERISDLEKCAEGIKAASQCLQSEYSHTPLRAEG